MNGYLVIGGPCDGDYFHSNRPLSHNDIVVVQERNEVSFTESSHAISKKWTYKAWTWHQGNDQRTRIYLISPSWDGFEAMDHLERMAYNELSKEIKDHYKKLMRT